MGEREPRVRVAMFEPDPAVAAVAANGISAETEMALVATVRDRRALIDEIATSRADVAVVDLAGADEDIATLVREILNRAPQTCVIVTGRNPRATLVGRAIAAGASTFLPKPYQAEELVSTIREIDRIGFEARRQKTAARLALPSADRGVVVTVYSPKGGVGCTTVATSLAVLLAARRDRRVGIVDLDLQFGDVGVALDLKGQNSFADLLGHGGSIDASVVEDMFVAHASGLRALLAPDELAVVEAVDGEQVVRVLDRLRDHFDYLVCDLHSTLDDLSLAALRAADQVVLVTTPELPSLRNLRRVINATASMLARERTLVAVNRAPGKVGIGVAEIERYLGMSVAVRIPSDGVRVTQAINQGLSVLDASARGRVGRSFTELAKLVTRDVARRPVPHVLPAVGSER